MAQIHALTPEGRLPTAAVTYVGELIDAAVPRIAYEWAGAPHASQSVRRTAGQETGRNLIGNSSFETGVAA